jgi:hypothetical protein
MVTVWKSCHSPLHGATIAVAHFRPFAGLTLAEQMARQSTTRHACQANRFSTGVKSAQGEQTKGDWAIPSDS